MTERPLPVFTSAETHARARGREFGVAWRHEIESCLSGYSALFRAVGASPEQVAGWGWRALDEIGTWAPALADELLGMADGAEMEPWQLASLNARTEILAAAGRVTGAAECSTAVVIPGGGSPRTIQTWDWRDTLSDVPVLWSFPVGRHEVRVLTEFGVLGKIGVNSSGVGVHLNILRHESDHADIGVPVHIIARRILDEATDVNTATQIARSARISASTVLTVVDFDGERGRVRGLELSPAGVAEISAGDDGVYLHTNHFLDAGLARGQTFGVEKPTTFERYEHLRSRVRDLAADDPTDRARAMVSHAEDGAAVCAHASPAVPFHLRSVTLVTIALDVAAHRLVAHRGGPCRVRARTWQTL